MRILLLSQFYPPVVGGEERHVRNLAAALVQRGHEASVATLWIPGSSSEERDGNVQVYRIRGTLQRVSGLFSESERRHAPPFPDPELVLGLTRVMSLVRPDVVHAHNWLLASILPLSPFYGARLVVTLHDYSLVCAKKNLVHGEGLCAGPRLARCLPCAAAHYGAIKGGTTTLANFLTGRLAQRAVGRFIAVSRAVARHSRLAEHGVAFDVIPNFVPDDIACPRIASDPCLRELPDGEFILFVGDLMRLKGVDVLLDAYAKLGKAPPLVLIGRRCGDTPTVLPDNVHLLGIWPHAAIMHAWQRCLFAVLPSVGPEACATVIIEAMASGKPIIATAIGGMPDLVEHETTGLLVAPSNADALAQAMRLLLDDRGLVARMGAASQARVENFKAARVIPRIEKVYDKLRRGDAGVAAEDGFYGEYL